VRWLKDHALILGLLVTLWIGAIAMNDQPYADAQDLPEDRVAHELYELQQLIDDALANWDRVLMSDRIRYSKAVQMYTQKLTMLIKAALERI
jgi:hypothetical protein